MDKRAYWLTGVFATLFLACTALNAGAAAPLYNLPGASFLPGAGAPMDLAAAVSDYNPSISGSANQLVQFTNGGRWVYNTVTQTQVGTAIDQWTFWCNGTGLTSCDPNMVNQPYDPQISYDASKGRWIVAALSNDANGNKGAYLYLGASLGPDPTGRYYVYQLSACTAYTGLVGDNPIMGISSGTKGRVVVDLACGPPGGSDQHDEVFDIDINSLEGGNPVLSSCNGGNCQIFPNMPIHLRPTNDLGQYSEVLLSQTTLDAQNHAGLNVYRLTPGSTIGADTLTQFDPRPGHTTPLPFYSSVVVYAGPTYNYIEFPAPQPGCPSSSTCAIQTDTFNSEGGAVQTNANGKDVFVTSFAAVAPNGTDSYYLAFILNDATGTFNFVKQTVTNGIIGYASSTFDADETLVVNYTAFFSSGPPGNTQTSIDVINWNPILSASIVKTYSSVMQSTGNDPAGACELRGKCRWGDYTAEVYDPGCAAVNHGKTQVCGLFWTTAEYTDGTTQFSQIAAVVDPPDSGDVITFVGSNNAETECSGSPCSVTFTAPAGTQVGDVLLVAMSATAAFGWVPSMPPGWTALTFQNQGGNPNFASTDSFGFEESAWLLAHVYAASDPGSYTFSEQNGGAGYEVGGLILGYRGVNSESLSFSAWCFGSTVDSATVSLAQITAPAYNTLVAVFKTAADDINGNDGGSVPYSAGSWSPPLTAETTMTPTGWTGFAADRWTYNGGAFGPYSVTASYSGLPLGWLVLLPQGSH